MPRIAVVVLNYRTPELTIGCLDSLADQVDRDIEVVVVDNASNDGSAARIEDAIAARRFDWARVIRSPINGGFAAGNNLGILTTSNADAFLLLNSDTIVRPGALASLRRAMESRPDAGLIGPRFEDGDGNPSCSTFRSMLPASELVRAAASGPITRLLPRHEVRLAAGDAPLEPDWIGFACVLIRRQVVDEVGLLDEGYFMYFEDVDYCRRVRDAGWTILYWPDACVVHLLGSSSHLTAGEQRRAPRYYYEARARYFATRYGRRGLLLANALYAVGACVSLARRWTGHRARHSREHEARDVWIHAWTPFAESSARRRRPE